MSDVPGFVIVGAGLAGAKAADALRDEGFNGAIVLLGTEAHRPYERPPLSKDYLQGNSDRDKVFVHPEQWYAEHDIDLRTGTTVAAIDRHTHEVVLSDRSRLPYNKLLITTGAAPRRLTVPGAELEGLHYLRSLDDSDFIKAALRPGGRVVIVGGGWIGLETAAAAKAAGAAVTVLEHGDLPLLRVLGPDVATVFADLHRENGVDLRCGVEVTGFRPAAGGAMGAAGTAGAVLLGDGTVVDADAIIVGVGVSPEVGLAESAGLTVDNGILADQHLQTSDPDIFAAGDVVNAYHPMLDQHLRVEHWANALNQPAVAAKSMLGKIATYDRLPYFFSDQFDLGMEYTGYADASDPVVIRGDRERREFIAFWLSDGRVVAGMNVNVWDVTDPIQALIRSGQRVDAARLADPDVPLDGLIAKSP